MLEGARDERDGRDKGEFHALHLSPFARFSHVSRFRLILSSPLTQDSRRHTRHDDGEDLAELNKWPTLLLP